MRKIFYLLLTPAAFWFAGCTKLLDQKPFAKANGDNFWNTANDAEKGLMGGYSLLRDVAANGTFFEYGDLTADIFTRPWNAGSDFFYAPGNFNTTSTDQREWATLGAESYQDWTPFFKVVNFSNVAIARIEEMPVTAFGSDEELKNKLLGEAYFLRATAYFFMVRIWGDVPLNLTPVESVEQAVTSDGVGVPLPRMPESDVLKQALADAARSSSLLKYLTPSDPYWGIRAGKGAAQALQAHIALWQASRGATGDREALLKITTDAVDSIMTYGNYSPVAYGSDADVKSMFTGRSSEAIFELNISPTNNESFRIDDGLGLEGKTAIFPTRELDNNYNRVYWVSYSKKNSIYDDGINTEDRRADLFFRAWGSTRTEPAHDNPGLWTDVTCLKKFENMSADAQAVSGETRAFFANTNIPVFRYSEIVLLGAEAYAKRGNAAKAKELMSITRSRAGLGPVDAPDDEIVNEVLKERRKELIGEGQIFYDCVRNNKFDDISAMTQERIARKGYFWPVRYSNIRKNTALVQTSYWIGKVSDN